MNRIAALLAATALTAAGLTIASSAPASADTYTRICYADPAVLVHSPAVLESGDSDAYLDGMIVRPFPDNAYGCASYDGTPLQEWETLYHSYSPAPAPVVVAEPAPAPVVVAPPEVSSTQTSAPVKHRCGKAHRAHRHYVRNCR